MWQKVYFWAKKIHRIVMWVVVVLGSWMMFSGYMMNRELAGDSIPQSFDMLFIRGMHVTVSMWFLFALLAQIATGLLLWAAPKIMAHRAASRQLTE